MIYMLTLDGTPREIEVNQVMGAGESETYYVYGDRFYWGRLRKHQDKWVFDPAPKVTFDFAGWWEMVNED
jgi:hypothetical protein